MKENTLFSYIRTDLYRIIYRNPSIIDFIQWYLLPKGSTFPYMVWFRIVHILKKRRYGKVWASIPYVILRHYEYKYGIHANTNIDVGKGLKIYHGDGVYLNCKSIGKNVTVYQSVIFGSNKGDNNIPTIQDNVTVYPGSVICGNIILQKGCTVGANSFVNKDVAEGCTVAGNPARIL